MIFMDSSLPFSHPKIVPCPAEALSQQDVQLSGNAHKDPLVLPEPFFQRLLHFYGNGSALQLPVAAMGMHGQKFVASKGQAAHSRPALLFARAGLTREANK